MKFKWNKLANNSCEYVVIIDNNELDLKAKAAKRVIISKIKIPGFRKGANIPAPILAKHLTKERIAYEAARLYIANAYEFALEQQKGADAPLPHKTPDVKIHVTDNLASEITFTFTPEVKVKIPALTSMNIKLSESDYKITAKKIDAEVERMRDEFSTMILREADEPIAVGDKVILDYEGTLDGKKFEGGSGKNHELTIGSRKFLPGFDEQLVGKKVGVHMTIPIHFSKDYFIKHLRDLTIIFDVIVHEARYKEKIKDEKEFITLLNIKEVKTITDVKKVAKKQLKQYLERKKEDDYWQITVKTAIKSGDFYYPEPLVQQKFNEIKLKTEKNLENQNLTIKMYAQVVGASEKLIYANMRKEAEWSIQQDLVVLGLAKNLGITIQDKDIEEYARKIITVQKPDYSEELLHQFIKNQRQGIYSLLMEQKTRENIIELFTRLSKEKKKTTPKKVTTNKKKKPTTTKVTTNKKKKPTTKKVTIKEKKKPTTKKVSPALKKKSAAKKNTKKSQNKIPQD